MGSGIFPLDASNEDAQKIRQAADLLRAVLRNEGKCGEDLWHAIVTQDQAGNAAMDACYYSRLELALKFMEESTWAGTCQHLWRPLGALYQTCARCKAMRRPLPDLGAGEAGKAEGE